MATENKFWEKTLSIQSMEEDITGPRFLLISLEGLKNKEVRYSHC